MLNIHIYLIELKSYKKQLFFWSAGIILLIGSSMVKFASFESSGQNITLLFDQFPRAFQVVFGLSGFDITTAVGFYGVSFIYTALMATIHASLLGADIISKEERDRTSEFLFVKPVSRMTVITSKLAAGLSNILIFNIVTTITSVYIVGYYNKGESATDDILLLMAGLLFLQLIFFFIGTSVASVLKRPKLAPSIATTILLSTLILSFMVAINQKIDFLKYFTPFKYFDALTITTEKQLDPLYVILSLIMIGILIGATYRFYDKRDLNV